MNTLTAYYAGFNGYRQISDSSSRIINRFTAISQIGTAFVQVQALWSRLITSGDNVLCVWGDNSTSKSRKIEFDETIISFTSNENICLILLVNRDLYKHIWATGQTTKLSFLQVEYRDTEPTEIVEFISSTTKSFCAITNLNNVYGIPTKIGIISEKEKTVKLVSGFEHYLVLLASGDLYTWGGGLKGQLGTGELEDLTRPTLVAALAGIKIVDIAAGGWHCIALSEFGDLYTWGWNINGQLGIKISNSIYALPEIVDIVDENDQDVEVISVSCGTRHTVVLSKAGKLYGTGSTKFGQLPSLASPQGFIDRFTTIDFHKKLESVHCTGWSTIIKVSL